RNGHDPGRGRDARRTGRSLCSRRTLRTGSAGRARRSWTANAVQYVALAVAIAVLGGVALRVGIRIPACASGARTVQFRIVACRCLHAFEIPSLGRKEREVEGRCEDVPEGARGKFEGLALESRRRIEKILRTRN